MAAAMDAENRRREVAGPLRGWVRCCRWSSRRPVPVSASGTWTCRSSARVTRSRRRSPRRCTRHTGRRGRCTPGPRSPAGYALGVSQPALRHVTDLGADGLFIEGPSVPAADAFTVVSPPARPGLLARLLGRLLRRRPVNVPAFASGARGQHSGEAGPSRSCMCSNRAMGVHRPNWWCYPGVGAGRDRLAADATHAAVTSSTVASR